MKVGIATFLVGDGIRPDVLARTAEERGLDSLFLTEHTHIPLDHSPYPSGGELPDFYKRTYDPFISCSFARAPLLRMTLSA